MSNISITDSNKMETVIHNFNNIISNIEATFEKEDNNFKKIDSTDIWNSDLQKSVTNKYNELSGKYGEVIDSLKTLSSFMNKTLNEYKRFENELNASIKDNSNQLDVNSQEG